MLGTRRDRYIEIGGEFKKSENEICQKRMN